MGDTDALAQAIVRLGGEVRVKYRNVKALAASIPATQLTAVMAIAGVTRVEKDVLVSIPEADPNAQEANAYLGAVPIGSGAKLSAIASLPVKGSLPKGYINYLYSGASSTWAETAAGEGSIVAVIDTGVARNLVVGHAVIGAPGYPEGFNATDDGLDATSVKNNPHGTWVAGVIAGRAMFAIWDTTDPLYIALKTYGNVDPATGVPLLGQAPNAKIYPVKIFRWDSNWTSLSDILEGIDHVTTLKKSGALDIDVVNRSFGGVNVYDGRNIEDAFTDAMTQAGILVVAAAGNNGPAPVTTQTPGSAFTTLTAGALDYAPSSRVFWEWLGLVNGAGPGQGMISRATDEVRLAPFSSRGPLRDGRLGPKICALGLFNFCADPNNYLNFVSGTSFASPTVAGAGALLNAYWEKTGKETDPTALRAALLQGANPELVGPEWRTTKDQGLGVLDVPAALKYLKSRNLKLPSLGNPSDVLTANALGKPVKGKTETWTSSQQTLAPAASWDTVIEVSSWTSKVIVEFFDIEAEDNSAFALLPNEFDLHLWQPAPWMFWAGLWPWADGDSIQVEIGDGEWICRGFGSVFGGWAPAIQPGLWRVTAFAPEFVESPVSCKLRITRENYRTPPAIRIANGNLKWGDVLLLPVEIPAGIEKATFDLSFHRDWSSFPTSNADMYILDASQTVLSYDGAGLGAPERAVLTSPTPGLYYVAIVGAELYVPDEFELFLTLE
ncbi:MAG: S8 family serine peptidase [Verrucomicrobiia bacterium]